MVPQGLRLGGSKPGQRLEDRLMEMASWREGEHTSGHKEHMLKQHRVYKEFETPSKSDSDDALKLRHLYAVMTW